MSNYDPNQPGQPYDPNSGSNGSNPYGQNPYGQNPQPYGQNPYGQPQQPASFNPYAPQGGYAPVQPPTERPKSLQLAFGLIFLAGIVNAVATWLLFNSNFIANLITDQWAVFQEQMQAELDATPELANDPTIQQMLSSPEAFVTQFNALMSTTVIVSIVISLVLYFLVGFFVGRGVNAMRIIATILAAFSVMGVLGSVTMITALGDADAGMLNAVTILSVALGVAGVVFAWLPTSSAYITQRRLARRAGYR